MTLTLPGVIEIMTMVQLPVKFASLKLSQTLFI
jgi:hypothetical protein